MWYSNEQEADLLVLVKEHSNSRSTVTVPTLAEVDAVYFPVKLKVVEPWTSVQGVSMLQTDLGALVKHEISYVVRPEVIPATLAAVLW